MSANSVFELVEERGWRRGFGNLMNGQLSGWFRSSRWWRQSLVWLASINMILFFALIGMKEEAEAAAAAGAPLTGDESFMLYSIFGGMFVAFGVMVTMQGAIVGERKSGTANWVLSKPVTRTSFVVSRLVGNTLGTLVTAVLIPGLAAYPIIGLLAPSGWPSPLNFLAGMAILTVSMFFWLTLTLVAGTFFDSVGGVIAVPVATFFAVMYLPGLIPPMLYISPTALSVTVGEAYPAVAYSLMIGEAPFSWIPLIAAILSSVVFVVVAIRRFNRQQF